VVERYADNTSVKSHWHAVDIIRQEHELLKVAVMVVLFVHLKTSCGSEGSCCVTYQSNSDFSRNSLVFFGTYTHKVVALFINPELLLHDYFRMCCNKCWFILTAS